MDTNRAMHRVNYAGFGRLGSKKWAISDLIFENTYVQVIVWLFPNALVKG